MSEVGKRRETAWTEERIRGELRRFLTGRSEWPAYRDFQRAGLKTLRDNVTRSGGARRWAKEMGVSYVKRRPGYAPIWTEERIRKELADYLPGRRVWPSREEFERDGLKPLRDAINRTGGPDRWAAEFGLPRLNRLSGIKRGWTPETVESEIKRLIGDGTRWPSRREFQAAGLAGMLSSIYLHEGPDYWAKRMGVTRQPSRARRPDGLWTDQRIHDEMVLFCADRDMWPTEREFTEAGRRALYAAASRKGGIPHWAERLGLPRRRPRP